MKITMAIIILILAFGMVDHVLANDNNLSPSIISKQFVVTNNGIKLDTTKIQDNNSINFNKVKIKKSLKICDSIILTNKYLILDDCE